MKSNYIHVCFIIDESGSMRESLSDTDGGVQSIIDEQKNNKNGECSISLYTFNNDVKEVYTFKNVNDVPVYKSVARGVTAMNDGIGTAIDNIGKYLAEMPENERPEQNLIVIITDGYENASEKYTFEQVKNKIKHQEEKYNWKFVYLGVDITSTEQASKLGIGFANTVSRKGYHSTYTYINQTLNSFRNTEGSYTSKLNAMCNTILKGV